MRTKITMIAAAVATAGLLLAFGAAPAAAHENRKVGRYSFTVGFGEEPAYAGELNSVSVAIKDGAGKPVTDLGDTLKVDVTAGGDDGQKFSRTLEPNFKVGAFGEPGDYRAFFVPTAPGAYTFHLTGDIKGQKVNQKFTSGPNTFSEIEDPAEIQFPIKEPAASQLAGRLDREVPRLTQALSASQRRAGDAEDAAGQARLLAIIGLVVGVAGLGAGGFGLLRKRA